MAPPVYLIDTNVLSMIYQGEPAAMVDLINIQKRGVTLVVLGEVLREVRQNNDTRMRGFVLALIRDLKMEVQTPSAPGGPPPVSTWQKELYLKANPKMRGRPVTRDMIHAFLDKNPKAQAAWTEHMKVFKSDLAVFRDGRRYVRDNPNADVFFWTGDRVAGPEDNPGVRAGSFKAVEEEMGLRCAPESRGMERNTVQVYNVQKKEYEGRRVKPVAAGHEIYELHPDLRGKLPSQHLEDGNGAFIRLPTPPRAPSTPRSQLRFNGGMGPGLKLGINSTALADAGAMLVGILLQMLVEALFSHHIEEAQKGLIERTDRDVINPKVRSLLNEAWVKFKVLQALLEGRKTYAKITICYSRIQERMPNLTEPTARSFLYFPRFKKLEIVDQPLTASISEAFQGRDQDGNPLSFPLALVVYEGEIVTTTAELTYTEDERDIFAGYRQMFMFCSMKAWEIQQMRNTDESIPASHEAYFQDMAQRFNDELWERLRTTPPPAML